MGDEIMERFFDLAGGKDSRIVVIPTASGRKEHDQSNSGLDKFLNRGATNVMVLHTIDPEVANDDDFVSVLKEADAVWFNGGRQWRLVDAYAGTQTEKELWGVLERDGVIGGSSAGATIQGSYLARGDTKNNQVMMGDHEEGFAFIKNIAIDQHVLARNRQFDLFNILDDRPELLGIGIDESDKYDMAIRKEAADAFLQAQDLDADFAMAYWGEAMTYHHSLWAYQDYEKAREIMNRLGETPEIRLAKAGTPIEKGFLQATEILFGEGPKIERDDAYAEHMESMYRQFPENQEVAAFYALSLLGSVEQGRDYEVYGKGASISKDILAINPSHPGALHYLIHSYDDPEHASLAIEAANSYSEVAPDAGHALHMPSHIYIALGMWDDVIASNIRSYEAKLKKVEKDSSRNWNLHAYRWLMYGHLQKGNFEEAQIIMDNTREYGFGKSKGYIKGYLVAMTGSYLSELDSWDSEYASIDIDDSDMNIVTKSALKYIRGYDAFFRKDLDALSAVIDQMSEDVATAENQLVTQGLAMCNSIKWQGQAASQPDVDESNVMILQLRAAKAILLDQPDNFISQILKQASEQQKDIPFNFGPPMTFFPSYEVYGRWLLEQGQYEEAMQQFDLALEKGPKRRKALLGKLEAARGLSDIDTIREMEELLGIQQTTVTASL
ncbi:cphB [Symbiodinium microadriaticum]|nr:cphB [Symbiodinium microadriaticum]